MAIPVNVDNFARAETHRMFAGMTGGAPVNTLIHRREPTPIDAQDVIRMNRDTLYSAAIVDISDGATVTIPDAGGRYLSVMVVNQDHYINEILHDPGEHDLTVDRFETPYVAIAARTLVDPGDPADVAAVHALQDGLSVRARSARPFELPDYDVESLDRTRDALLALARGIGGFDRTFGRREDVDPVRHLLGTAAGWGGLPTSEAFYVNVDPGLPVGAYRIVVRDVPVDAFWSISVYDRDGFFAPNDRDSYSVNSVTATRETDGSVVVHLGQCSDDRPNCIPITDGWNYIVRLYRPRPEVLDGRYTFPVAERLA